MALSQLLYGSEVAPQGFPGGSLTAEGLAALHENSQRQNAKIQVTGILLYNAGHFLQLLEGNPIVIRRLFEKIRRDRRHKNVHQLALVSVEARLFQDWSMGLLNFDERADIDAALFRDFHRDAQRAADSLETQQRAIELLKDFKVHLNSPQTCA